jgi:uncharacterized MAPEG superfamily protein
MSIELTLLVWSVALAVVQTVVAFAGTTLEFGLPDMAGSKESLPAESFAGRAQHASQNMLESLVLFAVLVIVTEITNRNNASTGLGAEVFFAARVLYAAVAMIGLPWLRAALWCVSIAALVLIFSQMTPFESAMRGWNG